MLVLLRLVIVTSLAGYSLPTASAAMHGSWSGSEVLQPHDHQGHVDDHSDGASDHHSDGDDASSSDDAAIKIAKQECCGSFCVSMAIVTTSARVGGQRVAAIREFIDDAHIMGEFPSLHRPPNI
ncbi:hypothetical protein [Ensifer adhaerens]